MRPFGSGYYLDPGGDFFVWPPLENSVLRPRACPDPRLMEASPHQPGADAPERPDFPEMAVIEDTPEDVQPPSQFEALKRLPLTLGG